MIFKIIYEYFYKINVMQIMIYKIKNKIKLNYR